jgi:hypothetical protein
VRTLRIVEVDEALKESESSSVRPVQLGVDPFLLQRSVEPLRFSVELRMVGRDAGVGGSDVLEHGSERVRMDVAKALSVMTDSTEIPSSAKPPAARARNPEAV